MMIKLISFSELLKKQIKKYNLDHKLIGEKRLTKKQIKTNEGLILEFIL